MRLCHARAACALGALLLSISCGGGGGSSGSGTFDATGKWSGTYVVAGSSFTFTAQVSQSGGTLSGSISIPLIGMSGAALSGTVEGESIQFGDIARTISFSGTANADDTAAGNYSISYGGVPLSGAWEGSCMRKLSLMSAVTVPSAAGSGVGLAWDGSHLWLSSSQQLAVVSTDGTLVTSYWYNDQQFPLHDFESLAFDGSVMWATEDGANQAWLYPVSVSTGALSSSVKAPPDGTATNMGGDIGLGLACDGSALWCLRNPMDGPQTIYRIDRSSGAVQGSIPVPSGQYGSIMVGGFGAAGSDLWISDRVGYLYRIRSSDGHIMRRFDYSGSVGTQGASPAGIAWDGSHLWVRDMNNALLCRFTVPTGRVQ